MHVTDLTHGRPALDDLFTDEPVYEVSSVADRYRYKKTGGSSDTAQTGGCLQLGSPTAWGGS